MRVLRNVGRAAGRRWNSLPAAFGEDRECRLEWAEGGAERGVALMWMQRPSRKNAFGRRMLDEFGECVDVCRYTPEVRSVILASRVGGVFSAGADLKERLAMSPTEAEQFVDSLRSTFSRLEQLRCPTIAVVDGAALGGGLEIALACDLRVCTATSKLGVPETSLAIIPGAGGTQRLPRVVGVPRAKELIFTATPVHGPRAEEIGLVNYCTENAEAAMQRALELSTAIAKNGPIALKVAKIAVQDGADLSQQAGMTLEQQCYAQVLQTEDRKEGLKAFGEKRKPVYRGV